MAIAAVAALTVSASVAGTDRASGANGVREIGVVDKPGGDAERIELLERLHRGW